uniref:Uncharacterized protein n=1 Tax=Trichobilharzia regenti TaxID=157069 RepID=A0AA85IWJ5_TRIRE|nr:unnamed protein product [Trichobilharzia regenti]
MKMAKNIVYGPLLFIIIIQAFTIFTKPGEADLPVTTPPPTTTTTTEEVKEETITEPL